MTPVAPRIVNDFSTRIMHASFFCVAGAIHLVRLEATCCSAHSYTAHCKCKSSNGVVVE